MFLRKTKVKGKVYYQIVEVVDGKQKLLLHLGTVEKILVTFQQKNVGDKAQQQKESFVYKPNTNSCVSPEVTNQHKISITKHLYIDS